MATTLEINGSRYLKGISKIIAIAAFTIACWAGSAAAQNVTAVVNAINDYSSGVSSLVAVVNDDNDLVTVTGEVTGADETLTLDIPEDVTVRWAAEFDGSTAFGVSLINLIGDGTFEFVEGGVITQIGAGSGIANDAAGTVNVSGGTARATATNGMAIRNNSSGVVNVFSGFLETTATNTRSIANVSTGTVNVFGGEIRGNPGTGIGNLSTGSVNILGGTIITGLAAITNESAGLTTISQANEDIPTLISSTGNSTILLLNSGSSTAARLIITGGTVENTVNFLEDRGDAIENRSTGAVEISGGLVRAKRGFAVQNTHATPGALTINGTAAVFAHGTQINGTDRPTSVINHPDFTAPTENGVIIAWDPDITEADAFSDDGLDVAGEGATAVWLNQGGKPGIRYERGENTGFIEIAEVTVNKLDYTGTVTFPTSATLTFGETLADAILSEDKEGDGTFAFTDPTAAPTVAQSGDFPMIFAPHGDAENYNTITQNVAVTVNRKPIAVPEAVAGLVYTGEEQTGVLEGEGYGITENSNIAINAGDDYIAVVTPDANHEWADGEDRTLARNVPWSIAKAAGAGTVSLAGWIFGDNANVPVPTGGTGGPSYEYKLASANDEAYSADVPTNAGNYTVRITFAESTNHLLHRATDNFTIARKPIAVPALTADDLVYTGNEQIAKIPTGEGYELTDNSATNANDNYIAIVTPDANHEWDSGDNKTATRNVPWSIAKAKITAPTAATGLVYTGSEQSAEIAANAAYEITGDISATNAGSYNATVALNDKANYEWEDGTTTDLELPWSIAKKGVAQPMLGGDLSAVFDGSPKTATLATSDYYETESSLSETNAGNFNVIVTLKDPANHKWNEKAEDESGALTLPWSIAKADGTTAPDYTAPATLTAKSDETLANVELPEGWKWDADPTTPVGEIGPNPHKATFTPANANYSTIASADWTIEVSDATSIFANRENPKIGAIGVQTYYTLKGTPLGTTKPTAPGVYLEKHGKYTRKIAVR